MQGQKDYLNARIGVRIELDNYLQLKKHCDNNNLSISNVLRDIIHESIKENHVIIKKGVINQLNGFDKI